MEITESRHKRHCLLQVLIFCVGSDALPLAEKSL